MFKNILILIFINISFAYALPSFEFNNGANARVVNGSDANINDYQFMVSLRYKDQHTCGGSLISSNWVLTAAHCVYGRAIPKNFDIQYNSTKISFQSLFISKIEEIIIHEKFDSVQIQNDIAVLKTMELIDLSSSKSYAMLPSQYLEFQQDTEATLIGWGLNKSGGTVQTILQAADLIIFSNDECSRRHTKKIFPSNICAGIESGGKGQCNGDSGGPLLIDGAVIGIVSWSIKPCTIAPYPGVYTKVSYFRDWISQHTDV